MAARILNLNMLAGDPLSYDAYTKQQQQDERQSVVSQHDHFPIGRVEDAQANGSC